MPNHHITPPAWSIVGLISSIIILIAHVVLLTLDTFASNVIGITYAFSITVACSVVVFATYYQRRVQNSSSPDSNTWALQTLNWLGIGTGSGSSSGRSQMSEGTRERLRIAGGGVFRPRVAPSVGSGGTTLPPYSPRRPERALSFSESLGAVGGPGGEPFHGLPPGHFPRAGGFDEREEDDLWRNRPVTPTDPERRPVMYA